MIFSQSFIITRIFAETHKRVEKLNVELTDLNVNLEKKVKERTEELLKVAHQAGMAEIAADALHNIGNFISGMIYNTDEIKEMITQSNALDLVKANAMLEAHRKDLGTFITEDPKGSLLPDFYIEVGRELMKENSELDSKADQLLENAKLILDILEKQRDYAKGTFLIEDVDSIRIIEEALMLHRKEFEKFNITVERKYNSTEKIIIKTQRAKLILSLSNIIKNAIEAMEKNSGNKIIKIDTDTENNKFYIKISDNGEGISEENMDRILHQGFTTKKNGQGIGLHFLREFHAGDRR